MTVYELSCNKAMIQGIAVREETMPYSIKGLYYEDENIKEISISKDLATEAEKASVLNGHAV